ncbi:MAG: Tol-Pal system beta propeller repeat protein TolB [Pseudomonadota bacterium]|jgi:TolB protein
MRLIIAIFLSWISLSAQALLTVEITKGSAKPTPIAIVPFGNTTGLPEDLQQIVSADLDRSGLFQTVAKTEMLSHPTTQKEVYFRDWQRLKVSYVVIGSMSASPDGRYTLHFELYDVLSGRQVFSGNTVGQVSQLRDIAHAVSDAVFEKITGIPGIFSTKMVYVEDLGYKGPGRYRLVFADIDGARERVLQASKLPILSPVWSHRGDKIAYVSFETTRPAIYIMELASGRKTQMTNFPGLNGAPAFSPDDTRLAMCLSKDGNPEIYVMNIASRQLQRITDHFGIDHEPSFSADGRSVLFTSSRGGSPQIYQVDLASGRPERVTFDGEYNARPRVTPDGKSIVMVHRDKGIFHIASQDLKTGDMRILTETLLDESPSVAPNGAMLLYATQQQGKGVLGAVSMDAGVKFTMPSRQGDVREPAWSPFLK